MSSPGQGGSRQEVRRRDHEPVGSEGGHRYGQCRGGAAPCGLTRGGRRSGRHSGQCRIRIGQLTAVIGTARSESHHGHDGQTRRTSEGIARTMTLPRRVPQTRSSHVIRPRSVQNGCGSDRTGRNHGHTSISPGAFQRTARTGPHRCPPEPARALARADRQPDRRPHPRADQHDPRGAARAAGPRPGGHRHAGHDLRRPRQPARHRGPHGHPSVQPPAPTPCSVRTCSPPPCSPSRRRLRSPSWRRPSPSVSASATPSASSTSSSSPWSAAYSPRCWCWLFTVALAAGTARFGWDPDNVMAPLVTAIGDLVTLPCSTWPPCCSGSALLDELIAVVGVVVGVGCRGGCQRSEVGSDCSARSCGSRYRSCWSPEP